MTNPFMNTIERIPLEFNRGQGSKLIDTEGQAYLDFWGDEGVASLGYCTPAVQAVFRDFGSFNDRPHRLPDAYPSELRTRAARALCEAARFDQAFFCNSGAEANEAAIKLARRYWSKIKGKRDRFGILTVEGNFHGRTGYALAASDSRDSMYHKDGFGPTPPGFGVIEDSLDIGRIWHYSSEPHKVGGDWRGAPAGDGHYWLSMGEHWSDIAAVIMAPILGNNTVKTYPKAFWERLQALREEHGFLLIFDEVQVATGRTGTFCAHHRNSVTYGVRPDIICIGKGIAAGLPAAMILADEEVASAFVPGTHFSTFGASLIVCQMMLEVIGWIARNHGQILDMEQLVEDRFSELIDDGLVTAYDGAGIHWGFTPNWANIGADGPEVVARARQFHLLLLTHRKAAPIRFTPPLNVTRQDMGAAFSALRQTLVSFRSR
jgi:acetylornithine/N-succinyldiaminopimelate aminotransferase